MHAEPSFSLRSPRFEGSYFGVECPPFGCGQKAALRICRHEIDALPAFHVSKASVFQRNVELRIVVCQCLTKGIEPKVVKGRIDLHISMPLGKSLRFSSRLDPVCIAKSSISKMDSRTSDGSLLGKVPSDDKIGGVSGDFRKNRL